MPSIIDASGLNHEYDPSLSDYRQAGEAGQSLQAFYAAKFGVEDAFQQVCAGQGIFVSGNKLLGIRSTTMEEIMAPQAAGTIVKDGVPASRIMFPAVLMGAVENKLQVNRAQTVSALDQMIAYEASIGSERYEHPVIDFQRPEAGRSRAVAQGALPPIVMTISVSDKSYRIPGSSIGIEVTDQALKATNLDLVVLALTRQAEVEANENAQGYMLNILQGDPDLNTQSLATLGLSKTLRSYDPSAAVGAVTHAGFIDYLSDNSTKRTLNWLVTDRNTARKIDQREGRPLAVNADEKGARFQTDFTIVNPAWATNLKLFLVQDPAWPAGTVMGLDSRYALRRVRSLSMDYTAVEDFVMRRVKQMRMDQGEHVTRMFDEAFQVLTLA